MFKLLLVLSIVSLFSFDTFEATESIRELESFEEYEQDLNNDLIESQNMLIQDTIEKRLIGRPKVFDEN